MLDLDEFIDALTAHLRQCDMYRLTGKPLLDWMRKCEVASNLLTAAFTDAATEAEAQGVPADHGCRDLAVMLRSEFNLDSGEAKRRARLVHELPSLPLTRDGVYAGEISGRQALVISDAVSKVPAEKKQEAEEFLCDYAATLNPRQLMYAGKRIRARVDPEGVYRDEQEGVARRSLRMAKDEHGYLHLKGSFDPVTGEKIESALHALSKPRPVGGERDARTTEQRYADGFAELVSKAMATHDLPTNGGERPQIIVTIRYEALLRGVGTGESQWGGPLSAALVRRMACDPGILPVVLGGAGRPLDVGREERFATPAQRKALAVRDKGCAFPGCDRPPAWTEAHHVVHWLDHGETDIDNLVLLCSHHHHVVHHGDWKIYFDHGLLMFIPPRWVDPDQQPMRNIRVDRRLA